MLATRRKQGEKAWAEKRMPKIAMGNCKREAQVSAGKLRGVHEDRLEDASDRLAEAEELVRDDARSAWTCRRPPSRPAATC